MKLVLKQSLSGIFLLLILAFVACEKNDSDTEFGSATIFMPQALNTGGSNLNYAIPSGLDSTTFNYKIDAQNNKVNVLLGVTRAGLQGMDAYTVNVSANTDTVAQLISKGTLNAATTMVLPSSIYTLPQTVSVPAGQSSASFYLAIDKAQLKTYAGKKLALGVMLTNPTRYTLNTAISKVIVIIDVNALKL